MLEKILDLTKKEFTAAVKTTRGLETLDSDEDEELVAVMTENITEFLGIFPQVLFLERNHSVSISLSSAREARCCGHADGRKAHHVYGHDFDLSI